MRHKYWKASGRGEYAQPLGTGAASSELQALKALGSLAWHQHQIKFLRAILMSAVQQSHAQHAGASTHLGLPQIAAKIRNFICTGWVPGCWYRS